MTGDLVDDNDLETALFDTKKKLQDAELNVQKLTQSNASLKDDLSRLRDQLRSGGGGGSSSASNVGSGSGGTSGEVITLKNDIALLNRKLADSESRLKSAEDLLKSRSQSNGGAEILRLQGEIAQLKRQLSSTGTSSTAAVGGNRAATGDAGVSDLTQARAKINKLEISLKEKDMLGENLKKKLAEQDAEIRRLRAMLSPNNPSSGGSSLSATSSPNLNNKAINAAKANDSISHRRSLSASDARLMELNRQIESEDVSRASVRLGTINLQNSFFHQYDEVDANMLKSLSDIMNKIASDPKRFVDIEDVLEIKDVFKHDSGRRMFTHMLRGFAEKDGKIAKIELKDSAYQVILYMVNLTLVELDLQNGADYISGKIIQELSRKLYYILATTEETGKIVSKPVFLEENIKEHVIWQSLFFWEEYFFDSIAHSFQKNFGDNDEKQSSEYNQKEKEFFKESLKKFAKKMQGWGKLPNESIEFFVGNIADTIGMDEEQKNSVISSLSKVKFTDKIAMKFGKKVRMSTPNPKKAASASAPSTPGSTSTIPESSPPSTPQSTPNNTTTTSTTTTNTTTTSSPTSPTLTKTSAGSQTPTSNNNTPSKPIVTTTLNKPATTTTTTSTANKPNTTTTTGTTTTGTTTTPNKPVTTTTTTTGANFNKPATTTTTTANKPTVTTTLNRPNTTTPTTTTTTNQNTNKPTVTTALNKPTTTTTTPQTPTSTTANKPVVTTTLNRPNTPNSPSTTTTTTSVGAKKDLPPTPGNTYSQKKL
eukprot:TRINITY_DN5869_c0_g2_i1.p2 TRINITY_DN5869_c0_g2~~TRINITY_DN5869_c0_g2_i1.p2  ORF type:complete len:765 (-),score=298.59 TRINITY_DN5869_c0_g2_i1:183-2477(-)